MTYAGVSAIHGILLAFVHASHPKVVDLDVYGVYGIVGITAPVVWYHMFFNRAFESYRPRLMLRAWSILVTVGTIAAAGSILAGNSVDSCKLPKGNATLAAVLEECTILCLQDPPGVFRRPSEATIMESAPLSKYFAGYADLILFVTLTATVVNIGSILVGLDRNWSERFNKLTDYEGNNGFLHAVACLGSCVCCCYTYSIGSLLLYSVPAALFTLIYGEVWFSKPSLPPSEPAFAVGQWSCWVATALVVSGAAWDWVANAGPERIVRRSWDYFMRSKMFEAFVLSVLKIVGKHKALIRIFNFILDWGLKQIRSMGNSDVDAQEDEDVEARPLRDTT